MLLSLVFELMPATPAALPVDQGRALESIFLEWVRALDPAYAAGLHDAQDKAFTISNLEGAAVNRSREALLQAQTRLTWRVTTFDPRLSALVRERVLPALPGSIHLDHSDCTLQIASVHQSLQDHADAAVSSFAEITQQILLAPRAPGPAIEVLFASPTSFRQGGKQMLFPQPENVFDSWLRRWNAFSPVQLPSETRDFAAQWVGVSRYRLETQRIAGEAGWELGFTGQCRFKILSNDPYWLRVLHTLAHFAFFCGTGRKTARGMGQTRASSYGSA